MLVAAAATAAGALAPAGASAAVSVTVTGDDGNPLPLAGALNIRNMNPQVSFAALTTDRWSATITGPGGAQVSSPVSCATGPFPNKLVDYIGNGTYTVTVTTYGATCPAVAGTQALPSNTPASTAIPSPPTPQLTRKPGSFVTNTIPLPID